jgi:mono/diheme cytochrome c family protein
LYQEKCVRCHGASGRGDGTMAAEVQAQFGSPVADLTSDVVARARTPEQWYNIVANGRLASGMPGFAATLDTDQRWDVIAYAWTLATPTDILARGQQVYGEQCAHCHGPSGQGDGPDAASALPDLSEFALLAQVEPGRWDQALDSGHVPSFAGTLSADAKRAAIDYVRTFAYDYALPATTASGAATPAPGAAAPEATPGLPSTSPAGPAAPVILQGSISNGTAGQSVPDNLAMTLYIVPHQGSAADMITRTFQSGAGGRFVITATEAGAGDLLAVGVDYKDLSFFSELQAPAPVLTVPLTIYENTKDAAQVVIDTLHIVAIPTAEGLNVSEIYVLSNNGDRFVAGFGEPVMRFGLPPGVTNVQMQDAERRVMDLRGDGLDYYDAIPIGSQVQQIVFQYTLPATVTSLGRTIQHPIGSVNLLVEAGAEQVNVSSNQLQPMGAQVIQGTTYQQYSGLNVEPGQSLSVSIGSPAPRVDWRIILGIGLVVVGAAGLILWQRGQKKQAQDPARSLVIQKEALIDQIAALDDDFAAGQLDEINYKAKRARLKEKLMKLMEEE